MNAATGVFHSTQFYYQATSASKQPHETDDRVIEFHQRLDQSGPLETGGIHHASSDLATKTSRTTSETPQKEGIENRVVTQADVTKSFNDLIANQNNHLLAAHKQQMQDIYDELEHPPKSNKQR